MKDRAAAEFAQFRFVRDAEGNTVPLSAQGMDERILLVTDCERWGLARLHIFEGVAGREDERGAFEEEMRRASRVRHDAVSRLISWGRDSQELFYADEMLDGEPLPDYLGRTGRAPVAEAARWLLPWIEVLEAAAEPPGSFLRYSTENFQVIVDRHDRVRLVFCEFRAWTKPGAQVREHRPEWYLAQVFCSLVAGVPVRTFHRESLPRNFEELSGKAQGVVLAALDESEGAWEALTELLREVGAEAEGDERSAERPLMTMREWLRGELEASYPGATEFSLPEEFEGGDARYAVAARIRGASSLVQVLPGPESIPREDWLDQHHEATRRPGRGMLNQLHVNYIEDRGSVTLIGEERVEGIDLASYLLHAGVMETALAARVAERVAAALGVLEQRAGACAVWWLPPENVFFATGTQTTRAAVRLIERKGAGAWDEFPVKLRLHQTTAMLRRGVNLPTAVRELSRQRGRKFEAPRRSAVALPLIWRLLTGGAFRWRRPVVEQASLPDALSSLFETYRCSLLEDPGAVETSFFEAFAATASAEKEEERDDAESPEGEGERDDGFEETLKATLYDGDIDLDGVEEAPVRDHLAESEGGESGGETGENSVAEPEPEPESGRDGKKRRRWWPWSVAGWVWLWSALAGVAAASATGYYLSGWSRDQGPYAVADAPAFPSSDYLPRGRPTVEELVTGLEAFFIERAPGDHLALLPKLERLEDEENRRTVEAALERLAAAREAEAARWLGLLALSRGEPASVYGPHLLRAAHLGDPEAAYRLADALWVGGENGTRIEDDELREKALRQLDLAARLGHAAAQELLAVRRVESAPGEAFRLMESSARQGNASAIYQLGLFFADGTGCEPSRSQAAEQFQAAAESGEVRAMFWLGRCLESGYGTAPSFTEARRWMKMASGRGHRDAREWCASREIEIREVAAN